jgi:mRNA interferase RelE/StbE
VAFRVRLTPAAARDLRALDRPVLRRIDAKLLALAEDPRPNGVEKLTGDIDILRVRVGDYRILYTIEDAVLLILVVRVRHRREVYRGL